jgi:periplasmic protein CpxP/Spy
MITAAVVTTIPRREPMMCATMTAAITDPTDPVRRSDAMKPGSKHMPVLSATRAAAIAALAIFAGATVAAQPLPAVAADLQLAQAATPAPKVSAPAAKPAAADPVETRIKSLHDQLKITAAEEPQWNAVAQSMRDNAKNTGALIAARTKKAKTMSAIDDLHSYRAILQAHLDGIDKLTTAFETLYSAMPDTQKKLADTVFARRPSRPAAAPKNG